MNDYKVQIIREPTETEKNVKINVELHEYYNFCEGRVSQRPSGRVLSCSL